MKKTFIVALPFILLSCTTPSKIINNAPSAYTIETTKNFEEVWSSVIDFVTTKGVSIKNIDKASGIIVTDDYSLLSSYTYEDKKGNLKDPTAYVVIDKKAGGFGNTFNPQSLTGNYNIRVKPANKGTSVTVNLVNLKGYTTAGKNAYGGGGYNIYYTIKSTNVFEKQLAEKLK